MKIEKLTENKIKITLNIDDLEEKNIDLYSFMRNTPETQDLFFEILEEAEKEYGFNVDNSMICVEASTSGSGNFSLIVTKTSGKPSFSGKVVKNNISQKKTLKLKRKVAKLEKEKNIYQFKNFDDVCSFANIINSKLINDNILYKMNNNYYLKTYDMPFHNILEYATTSNSPELLEAKLNEYGKILIEKEALQTIQKIFSKKKK